MSNEPDYYELLGVTPQSSTAEIQSGYRRLAKTAHPDVGGNAGLFKLIRHAYDTLSDPARRREYDRDRSAPGGGDHGRLDLIAVPRLIGLSVDNAADALERSGLCGEGFPVLVGPGDHRIGTVVTQNPPHGTTSTPSGSVQIFIAIERAATASEIAGLLARAAVTETRRRGRETVDGLREDYRLRQESRRLEWERGAPAREAEARAQEAAAKQRDEAERARLLIAVPAAMEAGLREYHRRQELKQRRSEQMRWAARIGAVLVVAILLGVGLIAIAAS